MLVMERGLMGLSFGEVVKRRRQELGLSQQDLAARFGRDATRISKVEQGHTFRRLPDAEEFLEWAEALELDPVTILMQMGYVGDDARTRLVSPEVVYTQLADEVRDAGLGELEQDIVLTAISHARRLRESRSAQ